jgi:tetratricopeptide (TPR) repeat protein
MTPQLALFRRSMIAALLTATHVVAGAAQTAQGCLARPCEPAGNVWVAAAQIHQLKNEFVGAIRQFTEAVAGTFGDEGSRVATSLDAMRVALDRWEEAIRAYQGAIDAASEKAEVHLALGSVFLDRNRAGDALREFGSAGRLEPQRVDVYTLTALAYDVADNPAKAAEALRKASTLDADNPITSYLLAQHLARVDQTEQADEALRNFDRARQRMMQSGTAPAAAPFERVSLLRQAAGVAPILPPARYNGGFKLLATGSYEHAIAEFRQAAAHDPLTTSSQTSVIEGAAMRNGRWQTVLNRPAEALAGAANDSETHRVLGVAYWIDGQFDKSIEELRTASRIRPDDERARIALADVLVEVGRLSEAERALQDTLQTIPDSGQAHERLGQLYQTQSLHPEAVREFERAATFDPIAGQDHLFEMIGALYANQANFDATVTAYRKRIAVNPNNSEAHRNLGDIYFLQGRQEWALAEFTAALVLDPRNTEAHAASAQVHLRLGRYADAASAATRALDLDPAHNKARFALATALMRLGRADEGRQELERFRRAEAELTAETQRHAELDALVLDAARSLTSGDYEAAVASLRKAITAQPGLAATHRDLGIALMKAGRHDQAVEALTHALQLEDGADVHRLLAEAYKALGRDDESQTQYGLFARLTEISKAQRLRKMAGLR